MREFGGRARFVEQNYGDSDLAKRFGVTRYPAIFVDDILVATPKDFGFFAKGEGPDEGRYAPLRSTAAHDRLRADLTRMITEILAGRKAAARSIAPSAPATTEPAFPDVAFTTLDGTRITRADLAGKVVLVEFWATWCPPCRSTLAWLGDLQKRQGKDLVVIAVSLESDEGEVRKLVAELNAPVRWILGTAEMVKAFGGIGAVPTLLAFDRDGRAAASYFGAPGDLHAQVEAKVTTLGRR